MPETKITQFNFGRVVRTEVLPYEIPYRFSFDCLDQRTHPARRQVEKLILTEQGKRIKPIQFKISKNPLSSASRRLTVMPPGNAIRWCNFYKKYSQVILSLCNRSKWSLRRPSGIAKVFRYTSADWNTTGESDETDGLEMESLSIRVVAQKEFREQNSISSFFVYSRCTTLHQFYNSNELRRLERKFSMCAYADISNCFNSIYSHSISWAILGKAEAKESIDESKGFDSDFDKLMRDSNYGETAGIPIGPEISRIFAEIILQRCDNEIEASLKKEGLLDREDYTIRRYIDDYFIFCNTEHHRGIIVKSISEEIAKFNLHLSEAKSKTMTRPFVSMISLCKKRISELSGMFFTPLLPDVLYSQSNSQRRAIKFVDDIRYIASEHSETFKPLIPFTLGVLKKTAKKALKIAAKPEFTDAALNRIIEIVCISEELLSMCLNFRVTIVIAEILVNISICVRQIPTPHAETIASFCATVAHDFLSSLSSNPPFWRADFFTLLLLCRDLGCIGKIPMSDIRLMSRVEDNWSEAAGFELCSVIYYYSNSPAHHSEVQQLLRVATERVSACSRINSDADVYCLAFDLLACPFLDSSEKLPIIQKLDPENTWKQDHWGRMTSNDCFFSWREDRLPSTLLQKKSLSSGY
jgi:hypothetical protein